MMGRQNGLQKVLSDWISRKLYAVHCMTHRLHLAIRNAIKLVPYYNEFEENINEIHNFYNRRSHKRKTHLRQLASVLKLKCMNCHTFLRQGGSVQNLKP